MQEDSYPYLDIAVDLTVISVNHFDTEDVPSPKDASPEQVFHLELGINCLTGIVKLG